MLLGLTLTAAPGAILAADDSDVEVAKFFADKTIRLIAGNDAGTSFDLYARLFARHMTRFIPGNPSFVVENLPGAGGIVAANRLFNVAPKDGTVMASFSGSPAFEPLLRKGDFQFDARNINWIGSLEQFSNVAIVWHTSPAKTFDDAFKTEVLMGATAVGGDAYVYPTISNMVLGTKFRVVSGYASGNIDVAMETGELHGRVTAWSGPTGLRANLADAYKMGKILVLAQFSTQPAPNLNAPMILDYVKDPDSRKLLELFLMRQDAGRPFGLPPGVQGSRVQAIRSAFIKMINDPAFNEEATRTGTPISGPLNGEELTALIERAYATNGVIVERARALVGAP
jgi:tripartite-type tricarboxylate transporter receptor subunit TctC